MCRDSNFCAKSVRYNNFTNGAPYKQSNKYVSKCFTFFLQAVNRNTVFTQFAMRQPWAASSKTQKFFEAHSRKQVTTWN